MPVYPPLLCYSVSIRLFSASVSLFLLCILTPPPGRWLAFQKSPHIPLPALQRATEARSRHHVVADPCRGLGRMESESV